VDERVQHQVPLASRQAVQLSALRHGMEEVSKIDWSSDGERLAALLRDGTLHVWDLTGAGTLVSTWATSTPLADFAWQPGGRRIALETSSGVLGLWDTWNQDPVTIFPDYVSGSVVNVSWSPDGRYLVAGPSLGELHVWGPDGERTLPNLGSGNLPSPSQSTARVRRRSSSGGRTAVSTTAWRSQAWRWKWCSPRTAAYSRWQSTMPWY
jgi:WD40 repeat protein